MQVIGSVLVGADEVMHHFVRARIQGCADLRPCVGLGVIRDETIVAGVLFHEDRGFDIRVSFAIDRPVFMPWRALFAAAFAPSERKRLTAIIDRRNKRSRAFCERLGFKMEGVHPRGVDGVHTAISYGMTRESCRWLRKEHGQIDTPRAAAA